MFISDVQFIHFVSEGINFGHPFAGSALTETSGEYQNICVATRTVDTVLSAFPLVAIISVSYFWSPPFWFLENSSFYCATWGVHVLRYPNFFLGNGSR